MVSLINLRQGKDQPINQALGLNCHQLVTSLLKLVRCRAHIPANKVVWSTSKVMVKWANMANTLHPTRLMVSKDRSISSVSDPCILIDGHADADPCVDGANYQN
jgi:hypothetical protein